MPRWSWRGGRRDLVSAGLAARFFWMPRWSWRRWAGALKSNQYVRSAQRSELLLVGFETLRRPFGESSENEIVARESAGTPSGKIRGCCIYILGTEGAYFPRRFRTSMTLEPQD
jgi:hypothetical protein